MRFKVVSLGPIDQLEAKAVLIYQLARELKVLDTDSDEFKRKHQKIIELEEDFRILREKLSEENPNQETAIEEVRKEVKSKFNSILLGKLEVE